jgi:ribonuclease E
MAIEVIRLLMLASQNPEIARVNVRVNDRVAAYLNNRKRRELSALEEEGSFLVQILGTEDAFPEFLEIQCQDAAGREFPWPY